MRWSGSTSESFRKRGLPEMQSVERFVRVARRGFCLTNTSPVVAVVRPAYDFLLASCYRRSGLKRTFHDDQTIRVRPQFRAVDEGAERSVYEFLRATILPGMTVLDVGANIGVFSLLMARWTTPQGKVFAFEPSPHAFSALEDHVDLNGVHDIVQPVQTAISDHCGTADFYWLPFNGESTLSSSHSRLPEATVTQVPVTTIDEFCTTHRVAPQLIKVDIEGFELQALQGACETVRHAQPIFVVEMHTHVWAEIGVVSEDVRDWIEEMNYRAVSLDNQEEPLGESGHVVLLPARANGRH